MNPSFATAPPVAQNAGSVGENASPTTPTASNPISGVSRAQAAQWHQPGELPSVEQYRTALAGAGTCAELAAIGVDVMAGFVAESDRIGSSDASAFDELTARSEGLDTDHMYARGADMSCSMEELDGLMCTELPGLQAQTAEGLVFLIGIVDSICGDAARTDLIGAVQSAPLPSDLTPAEVDFCTAYRQTIGNILTAPLTTVASHFESLAAVAPSELRSDLMLIADIYRRQASGEALPGDDDSYDQASAAVREAAGMCWA